MFQQNVSLKNLNNYSIGGSARYFFEARNIEELRRAVKEAKNKNLKIFVLGAGTNVLISDGGFDGLVLKPNIKFLEAESGIVTVGAGVLISELLEFCVSKGLSGLEWAGGLPGTVGGAVRGNAGAFGGEIKDVVKSAESLNMESFNVVRIKKSDCFFSYRSSVFKKNNAEIIVSAELGLKSGNPDEIKKSIQKKIDYRRQRHPLEYPNIGSIFKNIPLAQINADVTEINAESIRVYPRGNPHRLKPFIAPVKNDPFPVVPAAFLISEAGLKGIAWGGAMVSEKHPNFIINFFEATSEDVACLIALVKKEIRKRFQIELEEEIVKVD